MHVRFVDIDGDVHVAPEDDVYLDSEICDKEHPLVVSVVRMDDVFQFDVTKEEFERLANVLAPVVPKAMYRGEPV